MLKYIIAFSLFVSTIFAQSESQIGWIATFGAAGGLSPMILFPNYDAINPNLVNLGMDELNGPLFFGSVKNFLELFEPENDADDVIIEFQNSRVADHSAIEAIDTLAERYIRAGKTLRLRHLSEDCRELLTKAGDLIEVNVMEDPQYRIADDQLA